VRFFGLSVRRRRERHSPRDNFNIDVVRDLTTHAIVLSALAAAIPASAAWASVPWPNSPPASPQIGRRLTELAFELPTDTWTLGGGLTLLHAVHHELGVVRPTNDVEIVLRRRPAAAFRTPPPQPWSSRATGSGRASTRSTTAHRFVGGPSKVDPVIGAADEDVAGRRPPGSGRPTEEARHRTRCHRDQP